MDGWELLSPARWPALVYVATRLSGLVMVSPLWRILPIPSTARVVIVVVWAIAILPPATPGYLPVPELHLLPLVAEFAVGALLGIVPALIIGAASVAGDVVGLQSGLTLGNTLSPTMPDLGEGWSVLYGWMALALFLVLGGDVAMLAVTRRSFDSLPPGMPWAWVGTLPAIVELPALIIQLGLMLAAPLIVTLFVANLALGMVNRAIPSFNVMMSAFPVTIGASIIVAMLGLPLTASAFVVMMDHMQGLWVTLLTRLVPS
jgi:flagellar biosynthetic protein FliR